jgi:superfamily I DNA/RNA helicase
MTPKFISGPPGTGKTSIWLTDKYVKLLEKYSHSNIIVLSHTNVAADEIRDKILKSKEVKERGLTKKSFTHKISTIHSYCKNKMQDKRELWGYTDYEACCELNGNFRLKKAKPKDIDDRSHPFLKFIDGAHGHARSLEDHWEETENNTEAFRPYKKDTLIAMAKTYYDYLDNYKLSDYNEMIQKFIDKARAPEIDVLIVDEAQDSNASQRIALEKLATYAKEVYWIGDADQTIFEFAGADADYFHTLSKDAEQLEQGYRCGLTINTKCKEIIKPIWDHYGYTRVWKPAKNIIGEAYQIPSWDRPSYGLDKLLEKIETTKESFLFTYRGNPTDKKVRQFLKTNGIQFAHIKNTAFVSNKELRCHKVWPNFIAGEPMSLKQIKDFWDYIGSIAVVRGKGKNTDPFKDWVKQDYTIDQLISKNYLKDSVKSQRDFSSIRTKVDPERIKYIDNALHKGVDLDNDVRVKYGNIHDVKGTTFDNVIVDETRTRVEEYFTQLRLKFVAYSRGRIDYWTVKSSDKYKLGARRGSTF